MYMDVWMKGIVFNVHNKSKFLVLVHLEVSWQGYYFFKLLQFCLELWWLGFASGPSLPTIVGQKKHQSEKSGLEFCF